MLFSADVDDKAAELDGEEDMVVRVVVLAVVPVEFVEDEPPLVLLLVVNAGSDTFTILLALY